MPSRFQRSSVAGLMSCCVIAVSFLVLFGSGKLMAGSGLSQKKQTGWRSLFNGKTLDGWAATGNKDGWAVEEGAIACKVKGGGYLYTLEEFDDFMLSIDFRFEKGTNSGVFFRWSNLKDPVNTGIELQVLDSYGKKTPDKHDCGAIYDIIPPRLQPCRAAGEWNTALITCKKNIVSIEVNKERVAEMDLDKWTTAGLNPDGTMNKFRIAYKDLPRKGHIGLQDHGSRVWYRSIRIRSIPATLNTG